MDNIDGSSARDTENRSKRRATRIASILVALAAPAAALGAFARPDTRHNASRTIPGPTHPITARPADTTHDPLGSFGLQAYGLTVHFYGSAIDPDTSHSTQVVYYLNNTAREIALASQPKHGYSRTLRITGRLSDPDDTRAGLQVRTYDNGDVIASTRSYGKTQRYEMTVRLRQGANNVSIEAFNIGVGTQNVIVGRARYEFQPPWTSRYTGNQAIAAKTLAAHGWGRVRWSHWCTSGTASPGGARRHTTRRAAHTESRRRYQARRWPRQVRTGAPAPPRKSGGDCATSRTSTAHRLRPGRTSWLRAGTDVAASLRELLPEELTRVASRCTVEKRDTAVRSSTQ